MSSLTVKQVGDEATRAELFHKWTEIGLGSQPYRDVSDTHISNPNQMTPQELMDCWVIQSTAAACNGKDVPDHEQFESFLEQIFYHWQTTCDHEDELNNKILQLSNTMKIRFKSSGHFVGFHKYVSEAGKRCQLSVMGRIHLTPKGQVVSKLTIDADHNWGLPESETIALRLMTVAATDVDWVVQPYAWSQDLVKEVFAKLRENVARHNSLLALMKARAAIRARRTSRGLGIPDSACNDGFIKRWSRYQGNDDQEDEGYDDGLDETLLKGVPPLGLAPECMICKWRN